MTKKSIKAEINEVTEFTQFLIQTIEMLKASVVLMRTALDVGNESAYHLSNEIMDKVVGEYMDRMMKASDSNLGDYAEDQDYDVEAAYDPDYEDEETRH